ncbi:aldehyde dehydrogenase 3, member A2 [Phlyctochytrium planicorne]|nr:aldehyde dehydrogenase 3, member A2 [Phlyctochytrium planicorne]
MLTETTAGGVVVNDLLMNMIIPGLPFGGVGPSGMGAYHGYNGFLCLTHRKSTMIRSSGLEFINTLRYPMFSSSPFGQKIMVKLLTKSRPSFLYLLLKKYNVLQRLSVVAVLAAVWFFGYKIGKA